MKRSKNMMRILSLVLIILLLLPTAGFAQQPGNDFSGHWAEKNIRNFLDKGFISLYKDGTFKPDAPITRAEFAAMANKAFGFAGQGAGNFKDVKPGAAFYGDMAAAKAAGYLAGLPDGTVKPNGNMSRQEYAVIISRLLKLDVNKDLAAVNKFKDAAKIPGWSKGAIGAVAALGYMRGNSDNAFEPNGLVTRGQAVAVLERCYLDNVKAAYDKAGTYAAGNVEGSVAVNAPDVTLENAKISGNLIIGEKVGNGNVKLKNVTVMGDTVIKGGGPNSIVMEDSQLNNVIVAKADNNVRVVAVGKTTVANVSMQSGGKLEEQGLTTGNGFGNVTVAQSVTAGGSVILQGNFEAVQMQAAGAKLEIAGGSVGTVEVSQSAANAQINLAAGTTVTNLVVNSAAAVSGAGKVSTAQVNVQGVVINAPVTTVNTAAGVAPPSTAPSTPAPSTPSAPAGSGNSGGSGGSNNTPSIVIDIIPAQSIVAGSSSAVAVSSTPATAAKSAVSSNTSVATASVTGNTITVTGVSAGTATITVTCTQSGYRSASRAFTVTVKEKTGKDITIEPIGDQSVRTGASVGFLVNSTPDYAKKSAASSDIRIAEAEVVGDTVKVTGVSKGTATITVTCSQEGYTNASISFKVNVVSENKMTMSDEGNIVEGREDGKLITVALTSGKFADTLTPAGWTLKNLPSGVTKGKVTRISDTKATIALSGTSTVDYDSDITDVSLYCLNSEVVGEEFSLSCTEGVTLKAINDPESICVEWAEEPGTNGREAAMDAEALTVTLTGGKFVEGVIRNIPDSITLSGSATEGNLITKESVAYIDSTKLRIELAWNGRDYDEDKQLIVKIPDFAYSDSTGDGVLTGTIDCPATDEAAAPQATMQAITGQNAGGIYVLDENELEGQEITILLTGGSFANPVDASHWTITPLPEGVTIGGIKRVDDRTVRLTLEGERSKDFDADITGVSVSCTADQVTGMSTALVAQNTLTILANSGDELMSVSKDLGLFLGRENGKKLYIYLYRGTFVEDLDLQNWKLEGLTGVTISGITRDNDQEVTLTLSGSSPVNALEGITVRVSCAAAEMDAYEGAYMTGQTILFNTPQLTAVTDADGITEGSEDGEEITVTLKNSNFNSYYAGDKHYWMSEGLPEGVMIGSATVVDDYTVRITLAGSSMEDFDTDKTVVFRCHAYVYAYGEQTLVSNSITIKATGGEPGADTAAPVFDAAYPKAGEIGRNSFKLLVKLNEAGTAYYAVYQDGTAAPSAEELEASGIAVQIPDTAEVPITIDNLEADTAYDVYVVAKDAAGNLQGSAAKVKVTTEAEEAGDTTAPDFEAGYPKIEAITQNGFTLFSMLNEAGTIYYAVYEAVYEGPSVQELVAEGIAVDAPYAAEVSTEITGLRAGTRYDVYVVAQDDAGNVQPQAVKISARTAAMPGPISDFRSTAATSDSVTFRWTPAEGATAVKVQQSPAGADTWTYSIMMETPSNGDTTTAACLEEGNTYDFRLVVTGGINEGNSNVVTVTTAGTPPEFVNEYPYIDNVSSCDFILYSKLNEAGTVYYMVYEAGYEAPGIQTLLEEGTRVKTSYGYELVYTYVEDLQSDTEYNVYMIAEDKYGNLQEEMKVLYVKTKE